MAPIQSKPELPVSPAGALSQSPGSATVSAVDQNNDDAQQTSLGSTRGVTSSPSQSSPPRSRPILRLRNVGLNIGSVAHQHTSSSSGPTTQKTNNKRKADPKEAASRPSKAPRPNYTGPARAHGDISPDPPDENDPTEPSEAPQHSHRGPSKRPDCELRDIINAMIRIATSIGLSHFRINGRPYYIRVGTVCSGTDAPIHVMEMFSMFKDDKGNPIFVISNEFACEIEWWKQSFLKRNSKPKLLFKDARDFAQGDSERAHLVTGAEADIPPVDFFIAGTSCVDFSTLNTNKTREFAGLKKALEKWQKLKKIHGENLSYEHLSPEDWRSAMDAMNAETEKKNQSEQTFCGAINYIKCRQPKVVICENVDSAPWQKLVDNGIFQLMGYAGTVMRLDTKHFYMPQTRIRKYLILFSHRAFTLAGAQALSKMFRDILPQLQHTHSNSVLDFLFPLNSHELQKARNEVESDAQGSRERETNWSISRDRHEAYRRKHTLPDLHPWMQWFLNAHANSPANMWKPWANRMPLRVLDVLDCLFLYALYGKSIFGPYDMRYKAQIIDCSQNVDRISPDIKFGRTGCLTPNAIPVLTLEARPIIGAESLRLQGLPVENFDMSVETQAQLQDLAGNAMTTTVVGAVILAALTAIARVGDEEGYDWLQHIFDQGDLRSLPTILNSFHHETTNVDHGPQFPLNLKLYAHNISASTESHPQSAVQEILELGKRARRRCPCHHILSYSSVELYVCTVCGVSHCKSCKGNPEHNFVRSEQSLEDLNSLPYAQAEYEFRKRFPAMLWMQSSTATLVEKLDDALLSSTCDSSQRHELANAVIDGLCRSIYQLQLVEIADAVRLEYVAGLTSRLRVVVEENEVTWSLHLDQYCHTSGILSSVLPKGEPIARAILGREEKNLFPDSQAWEFWIPHHVSFPLEFEVQEEQALSLVKIGDLDGVPEDTKNLIRDLEGSLWVFHPECCFPEYALWVHQGPHSKYFLFKDIDPIGAADQDAFVITPVSREMGRRAPLETRPVLLRISKEHQIHRSIKDVLLDHGPFLVNTGHKIPVQGYIGGSWGRFNEYAIDFTRFPNTDYDGVKAIAKAAPTSIRRSGHQTQAKRYEATCDEFQSLLTTSLPILGNDEEVNEIEETLKTLDLTKPLDVAELTKLTGPLYSAVEMGLVGMGKRVVIIQENVELNSDCHSCAPKIPEVFYVKSAADKAGGSRATGPVVARHRAADQQNYELDLQSKPRLLYIDHNVTSQSPFNELRLKQDNSRYVDVCFLAHGHALLHQARAHLPQHPSHFEDTTYTRGTFAIEFAVIENPRIVLSPPTISAPSPVTLEDARLPSSFQNGLLLFKEQSDSLQWMLSRETVRDPEPFMEIETAEVHQEQYRMRVHANAERPVYRRGRVVADNVGFGKTAVCLGLIDVQRDTDRKEFMLMRQGNEHLQGLVHLHATLIIVPNQLTHQWQNEAKRFLGTRRYNIVVIPNFTELQKCSIARLRGADIVICSNKVFLDNKYHSELSRYCSPNDLDKIQTMQKVYRAWYKQFQRTFEKVRDDVVKILERGNDVVKAQQMAHVMDKLDQIRADLQELDGEEQLAFAPADNKTTQSRGKKGGGWVPQLLFEMLSWSRIIWDEFPYENIPVTEFVANSATTSKWMLSGTPPLNTLGDVCKIAYLFNVHVARPLQLIKGRQPPICENEPLAPHSDLESTGLFQSRPSLKTLQERHLHLQYFVSFFMRKNHRDTEVAKIELPIVLTMSPMARLAYAELQVELQSRQYNANNVGTECRRRLMGHIDWRGKESGRDRSVEALTVRASASIDDVLEQSGLVGLPGIEAARKLLSNTDQEIHGIEDRGRELLGKAIFLAYRLTFITLSNAKEEVDGQDERHLDYYQSLVEIVESVLTMDMKVFQSWDAFNSAMRILIWPEPMRESLGAFKPCPDELPPVIQMVFDHMRICAPPTIEPKGKAVVQKGKARKTYEARRKYFETFRAWLTKTPLHSRRWFLVDKIDSFDAAEEELLELEWSAKLTWEEGHEDSERGHSGFVLPHKLTEPPNLDPNPDKFDLEHLKSLDSSRRDQLSSDVEAENKDVQDAMKLITGRKDYKDSKAFWEEECNRRGLIAKSIDKKEVLKARVAGDISKTATDKDYISPESCGVTLADFPQAGKRRIRGGFMEVIFDSLMQALDGLTSVLERSVVIHARRNLQQVVVEVLGGTWTCHNEQCGNDLDAHFVSLICGHVFCGKPDDSQPCGVGLCQRSVNNVCIPLSEIRNSERVIAASSLSGAITSDPDPYIDSEPDYEGSTKGPKARAIINLIRRIRNIDQVVVFVQTATMEIEIYSELAAAKIKHVTASMLSKHEAASLEDFKNGRYKVLVQTVNSEQAAGSNLHNANHVIFVSPLASRQQADWDAQMRQALGRCVRFRQSKKVYVYHMLMDETAEVDTLEWRMKKEVIVTEGQAVGRFNDCATKDFLARYEGDETATAIQMAPDEGRAHSILPRDDVQYLMGDDMLSLAAIKALRTIDESMADKVVEEEEEAAEPINPEVYIEPSYLDGRPQALTRTDSGVHLAVTEEDDGQEVAVTFGEAVEVQDVAMAEAPYEWDNIYDSDA